MAKHRFEPHHKVPDRGGSAHPSGVRTSLKQRGGFGDETAPPGAGSKGFRLALHKSGQGDKQPLKQKLGGNNGPGFQNPSQFAQGGHEHGMHLGGTANLRVEKATPEDCMP